MTTRQSIEKFYPGRLHNPQTRGELPAKSYMVYILLWNDQPIVLGHGLRNRAKVIFDDLEHITSGHIKALFVRIHHLFGNGNFERYVIECQGKSEAQAIEKHLHKIIGGDHRKLPEEVYRQLFHGVAEGSVSDMVLRIALNSSFDGIADLKLWRRKGILADPLWSEIAGKLQLKDS